MQVYDARGQLERLVEARRETFRSLSLMLGRNAAYLQQYVKRGTPAKLGDRDRRALADYLGVAEDVLRDGLPPRNSERASLGRGRTSDRQPDLIIVPRLEVEASAGPGALAGNEQALGHYGFDRNWLQRLTGDRAARLSVVRVKGDSMAPTLVDGDDILVQELTPGGRVRDGIHVLQRDDALLVKRVALGRMAGKLDISSDNSAYPSWSNCDADEVNILGRVIWSARRLN